MQHLESQTFRLPLLYRVVIALLFPFGITLPFIAGIMSLTQGTEYFWLSVIGTWGGLTAVLGYIVFRYLNGYQLVISLNEIRYVTPSYEITAKWPQIKKLKYSGGVEGLHAPDAAVYNKSRIPFFESTAEYKTFIPVGRFAIWGWWRGPIGQLLKEYVPHIFVAGNANEKLG